MQKVSCVRWNFGLFLIAFYYEKTDVAAWRATFKKRGEVLIVLLQANRTACIGSRLKRVDFNSPTYLFLCVLC